ncbi:MAG: AraC family transcriptional regulator [Mucilaginibacter sp.]|uniref:helix-turn-helix transcriptional regulator n=1 Tax=Mucilaginibacter sp. TaxID=1882438 RepID=UPI0031A795F9
MITLTQAFIDEYLYTMYDCTKEEPRVDYNAGWGSVSVTAISIVDIGLFVIEFNSHKAMPVAVGMDRASLMLLFTLSGRYQLVNADQVHSAEFTHKGWVSTNDQKLTLMFEGNLKIFAVCFLDCGLKGAMTADLQAGQLNVLQSVRPTTAQMSQTVRSIMDNMGKNGRHHIYAKAKALELLYLEFEQLETLAGQQGNLLWKEEDHDRIHQAKTIIEENLISPCSLIELAHKVGLNDFKLKKGFREVLGTTVFGYLYELRMKKATSLLKEGKLVRDVAYEVGYKNAHHFTVAFKKKFGYLPSKVSHFLGICFYMFLLN